MSRKIIQISAVAPGRAATKAYHPGVLALADDGSVWGAGFNPSTMNFNPWIKLPILPATDQEAQEILETHRAALNQPQPTFWHLLKMRLLKAASDKP
jgi:hypothetical protein